jgi:hypothetical protein
MPAQITLVRLLRLPFFEISPERGKPFPDFIFVIVWIEKKKAAFQPPIPFFIGPLRFMRNGSGV